MSSLRIDIISIGTLSKNRLWNETVALRTPHATTSLIRGHNRTILVDPGLPPAIIAARLQERSGLDGDAVDTIFFTNLRPAHVGGANAFEKARLLAHEPEIAYAHAELDRQFEAAEGDADLEAPLRGWQRILERVQPADDSLVKGLDLFPLPGFTPGTCGMLVNTATMTTLVAGDAVPTLEHFLAGQVLQESVDLGKAKESLAEAYEIADLIVPGHDNVFINPRMQAM